MTGKSLDVAQLKTLSPLDGLKAENLRALADKTVVHELPGGRFLFRKGDTDRRTFYVISGEVELRDGDRILSVIEGGTPDARRPLATSQPRRVSARARSRVEFVTIDADLLDVMLTWDQTGSYEVSELQEGGLGETDDWMTTLLQTKAFHRIPAANIQAIFIRMQQVNLKAGDVVIRQGDEGDYFYVITAGHCAVTRETPLNRTGIKLAELGPGDTFGEEALISRSKRNATVTMTTDGTLMRLAQDDFNTLMNEPLLQWADFAAASKLVREGARWLDVRLPSEFQGHHLEGAINIPLYFIRLKLSMLDRNTPYVVYCDTGRRSSAAAFILSERGFEAHVLHGGLTMAEIDSERR
jgi:CRP-like cAMP-binding protein